MTFLDLFPPLLIAYQVHSLKRRIGTIGCLSPVIVADASANVGELQVKLHKYEQQIHTLQRMHDEQSMGMEERLQQVKVREHSCRFSVFTGAE